jgi:hypothetical protein
MKRKGIVFSLLALVILVGVVGTGPTSGAAPVWTAEFDHAVAYGQFINGNVTGPAGGSFSLTVNAQPFNGSTPIIAETYHMSANQTKFNLTIPTAPLTLGEFQLTVASISDTTGAATVFFTQVIQILDPLNATQVNQELYQLNQELAALESQVLGLAGMEGRIQLQNDLLFWVFFGLFILFTFIEGIKAFLKRRTELWTKARRGWRWFWKKPAIRTYSGDILPTKVTEVVPVNLDRKWVTGYGPEPTSLRTEAEMVAYLTRCGRVEPVRGRDYWVAEGAGAQPTPPPRSKEVRRPNFRLVD